MKRLLVALLILPALFASAQKPAQLITVTDLTRIKTVTAISFSHNGEHVAYSVQSIVPDTGKKKDKEWVYRTQIFVQKADGKSAPVQLTKGLESASQPDWSPDDKTIAFIRKVKDETQVFTVPASGGEPQQITSVKQGASDPHWLPDGSAIVYSSPRTLREMMQDTAVNPKKSTPKWAIEKPGVGNGLLKGTGAKPDADGNLAAVRSYLTEDEKDKKAKVFNRLNFQGESNTNPDLSFVHLFKIDAKKGAKPAALTSGFYSYKLCGITPDSKTMIVTADIDSTKHPDRSQETEVYEINLGDKAVKQILGDSGKKYQAEDLSPDGRYIAYQVSPTDGINVAQAYIFDRQNPGTPIAVETDRSKTNFTWAPDSKNLFFTTQSNGGAPLYQFSLRLKKAVQLSDMNSGIIQLDVSKNKLAYLKTEPANPAELYLADFGNKKPQRIGNLNTGWLADKKLSIPKKQIYTDKKGLKIEYWVMKPTGGDSTKKAPVMLQIHGGPAAMWGPGETSMWHEYQFFCARGYGVVYSNPRGSGGYGQDFLRANYQDWGSGPSEDVLGALDGALKEPWADSTKKVVTGGSYAGYLTAWLVGHSNRFKAASAQRGVYELSTFFGEGNAWRLVPNYFGGYPWDSETRTLLDEESPFTYVNRINTPMLIFHGESDLRTGVIQSEMMYKALKVLGKPVEYVRHPNATHELSRSGNVRQRIDQMLRIYEFFERYVKH